MNKRAIRSRLLQRRKEVLNEIEDRDEEIAAVEIEDEEDKTFERLSDEVLSALSHSDRDEILSIDAALTKIAEGTYGICEECGEKISAARLEAKPDAVLCITCATRAEQAHHH